MIYGKIPASFVVYQQIFYKSLEKWRGDLASCGMVRTQALGSRRVPLIHWSKAGKVHVNIMITVEKSDKVNQGIGQVLPLPTKRIREDNSKFFICIMPNKKRTCKLLKILDYVTGYTEQWA